MTYTEVIKCIEPYEKKDISLVNYKTRRSNKISVLRFHHDKGHNVRMFDISSPQSKKLQALGYRFEIKFIDV